MRQQESAEERSWANPSSPIEKLSLITRKNEVSFN